jgi:cell division transport system ATP-binding protein
MNETREIEELIRKSKRDKIDVDFDKDSVETELNRILQEERILNFTDMTGEVLKKINLQEDMSDFDYLNSPTSAIGDVQKMDIEMDEVQNILNSIGDDEIAIEGDNSPIVEETVIVDNDELDFSENQVFTGETVENDTYQPNFDGDPIIKFENIAVEYDGLKIIKDISLEIFPGEFVYIVGPSGAGKSSLAKLIYRDVKNSLGKVYVDGENITRLKTHKMPKLRRKIGVIFQDYKLLNNRTVYDNVNYSLEVTGFPKKKRKDQVLKTLKIVGIIDQKDKFPNELSGGQQQRVAIARAIVDEPKIIVADEPTGNLDPKNAIIIMEILNEINKTGTTIVMATHDVGIVNKYKKRVVLVKDGMVVNETEGEYIYE